MIWHIFRKDFRLTWKFALAAALLQWISIAVLVKMGLVWGGGPMMSLRSLVRIVAVLATCLVVITVVQQDTVPGSTEDWLMRPIRRRDMLLAKGLFVLLAVQLPLLIGCTGEGLAFGLGFRESLLAALWQGAMMTLGFFVPALAVAAMTSGIVEAAVLSIGCVFTAIGLSGVAAFSRWSLDNTPGPVDWMEGISLTLGLFIAGIIALRIQYRSRKTVRARFASIVVFTLGAAAGLLPWQTAFAFQQRVSPAPGAARNVSLVFDLTAGRKPIAGYRPDLNDPQMFLPVRAEGLTEGTGLVADRVELHLTGEDGTVTNLTPMRPSFAADLTWQHLVQMGGSVRIPRHKPVRLAADYWLTLVRETGAYSIPPAGRDIRIPTLGRCNTRVMPDGEQAMFACAKAGPPVGCFTVTMNDYWDQLAPQCSAYAPPFVWLPDWDEITRMHADSPPVPSGVITTYAVLDHFVRHLEIPSVRLADWEARSNAN